MSKQQKNVCKILNYIEHLVTAISTITRCVCRNGNTSSVFASLVQILIGITIFTTRLKLV